jgi:hypothetical protein
MGSLNILPNYAYLFLTLAFGVLPIHTAKLFIDRLAASFPSILRDRACHSAQVIMFLHVDHVWL